LGFSGSTSRAEGFVVRDGSVRPGRIERQRLKILRGNTRENKVRIVSEAKAAVIFGRAEQYTASRTALAKDTQRFMHQAGAHATTLMLRHH
jgi:hypothetical protein